MAEAIREAKRQRGEQERAHRRAATEGKLIVVMQHGGKEAGFLVDEVRDVKELPASSVLPVLDSVDPSRARLFEGTVTFSGQFVGLLSPSACLNP